MNGLEKNSSAVVIRECAFGQPKWIFRFSFLYSGGMTKDAQFQPHWNPTYVLKNVAQNVILTISLPLPSLPPP